MPPNLRPKSVDFPDYRVIAARRGLTVVGAAKMAATATVFHVMSLSNQTRKVMIYYETSRIWFTFMFYTIHTSQEASSLPYLVRSEEFPGSCKVFDSHSTRALKSADQNLLNLNIV